MSLTVSHVIVNLAIADIRRSLEFYVDRLGFRVLDRMADDWTLLQAGNVQIALVPAGQPVRPQAVSILLVVPSIDRALRDLTRARVEITEYYPEHDLAQFQDPDGHLLGVVQQHQEAPHDSG